MLHSSWQLHIKQLPARHSHWAVSTLRLPAKVVIYVRAACAVQDAHIYGLLLT